MTMKKARNLHTLLAVFAAASTLFAAAPSYAESENAPAVDVTQAVDTIQTNEIDDWPIGPAITSTAAIVMEPSTGTVTYSKNADLYLYPSSSVKIMTALVALENSNLTDTVTVTATGLQGATDGGAHISARLDETFTMEQCLYAIILASANDMSLQVAEQVGGSIEGFVEMMNQRAKELGCTNTYFTNPTGMPDTQQYTTASDLSKIMIAAMQNESFREISGTMTYTIQATNLSSGVRTLSNTFTMLDPHSDAYYEGCLGGKEGYTSASNSVLVCMANRNDTDLVCVVMNGESEQTDDEAITILDYTYHNFEKKNLAGTDFNTISGGDVYVPTGTSASQITATDTTNDEGYIDREFSFHGAVVGAAIAEVVAEEENTLAIESEKHLEAAKIYSENLSILPYIAIFVVGALLILGLIILLIRIIKKD